jgi:hypothetical protein
VVVGNNKGRWQVRFVVNVADTIPSKADGRLGAHAHHPGTLPGIFGEDMLWEQIPQRAVVEDAADEAMALSLLGSRATEILEVVTGIATCGTAVR